MKVEGCIGCKIGFPTYTNERGTWHEDGAGGVKCEPHRHITPQERGYLVAMIRGGFVTSDPASDDKEVEQ